ncbi:hypothetical protein FHG87_007144 [Trinorchestia longiramus]|nr:hypothetical protein FHG87_007144 [Trinorchestia longiramus]
MRPRDTVPNQMGPRGPGPNQIGLRSPGSNQIGPRYPGPNQIGPRGLGPNSNQIPPNSHGGNGMGQRGLGTFDSSNNGLNSRDARCEEENYGPFSSSAADQGDNLDEGAGQASDCQYSAADGDRGFSPRVKRARLDDESPLGSSQKSVSQMQGLGEGSSVYFTVDSNIGHHPVSDEPKDFAVPIVVDGESLAAGGSTGILLKKLAGCVIKSEKDAELALTVSNALVSSLREYYIRKEELKTAEVSLVTRHSQNNIRKVELKTAEVSLVTRHSQNNIRKEELKTAEVSLVTRHSQNNIRKEDLKTAELLMNAELKLNTLKAMKVGLKLLDEELMKTPSSSAGSRRPVTQGSPGSPKAAQLTAFPAPSLTQTPTPSVPPPFNASPSSSTTIPNSYKHGSYSTAPMNQTFISQAPPTQPDFSKPPPCAPPTPVTSVVASSGPPPNYGYNTIASQYNMNTLQPPGLGVPSYSYSSPVPYPCTYPQVMYTTPAPVGQYNIASQYSVPPPTSVPAPVSAPATGGTAAAVAAVAASVASTPATN